MKVKVGDTIYSGDEQPIMVILTDADKYNITHMLTEATKYAEYPADVYSSEEIADWMEDTDGQEKYKTG